MPTIVEQINSDGLVVEGHVHKRKQTLTVANPDYVLVARYVVYARELLSFIRQTIEEGGRLRLQCMYLERLCKTGLGYDPELLTIIGTTQEEVEQLLRLEHIHEAIAILDIIRDIEARGERLEPYMGRLVRHCASHFNCDPTHVSELGISSIEFDALRRKANVKEAVFFLNICRMERDRGWSTMPVERTDREWPGRGMHFHAGYYLRSLIRKHEVTCEEIDTTLDEVESFPNRVPRLKHWK